MLSFNLAASTALLCAVSVAAHGHVEGVYTEDGEFHQGWDPSSGMGYGDNFPDVVGWTTTVQDNGFVGKESHGNFEIACHRGASPAALSVEVAPGGVLTLEWDTWPVSHHGPVLDYLAACGSSGCSTVEVEALDFFKISEVGCVTPGTGDNGVWGADVLIANDLKWQVQIPDGLAAGEYVLRHEIIALHSLGEPQHYPQCVNLVVTGSGTSLPTGVPANELYTDYEDFNIYQPFENYPIPGPAMIAGASPILEQGTGIGIPAPPTEDGDGDFDEGLSTTPAAPEPTPTAPAEEVPEPVVTPTEVPEVPVEEVPVESSPAEGEAPATPTKRPCSRRRRARRAQD